MRVAKTEIYSRASSIPKLRFEDQELTSYAGIVVFQKAITSPESSKWRRARHNAARLKGGSLCGSSKGSRSCAGNSSSETGQLTRTNGVMALTMSANEAVEKAIKSYMAA